MAQAGDSGTASVSTSFSVEGCTHRQEHGLQLRSFNKSPLPMGRVGSGSSFIFHIIPVSLAVCK